MLRKTCITFGVGALWLFLFSVPVGRGKQLFDVLHYYVVDTTPVNWVIRIVGLGITTTGETAKQTADDIVGRVDDKLTQSTETQRAE